jgi:hypothetical protein
VDVSDGAVLEPRRSGDPLRREHRVEERQVEEKRRECTLYML